MSKKNGVCKEEVCFCIRDAILDHDRSCMFTPEDMNRYDMYLHVWDEIDEDEGDVLVIVNPMEEFVFDTDIYYRAIKTISGDNIYDFRLIEKKFGIYVYLRKSQYGYADYVFYYKGKVVLEVPCPPTFHDVSNIIASYHADETLLKHREVLVVLRGFESLCSKFRNVIRYGS